MNITENLVRAWYKDPLFFLKTFWGGTDSNDPNNIYYSPFGNHHRIMIKELVKGLDKVKPSEDWRKTHRQTTLIMTSRESGKSKVCAVGFPIWSAFLGKREYMQIFSKTGDNSKAEEDLADIKTMLTSPKFVSVFGDVVGSKWGSSEIEIKCNLGGFNILCKVTARGWEGATVGSASKRARPDLIIIDDLEDTKSVQSKTQIDKRMRWVEQEIIQGVQKKDPYGRRGQVVVLGTPYHPVDNVLFRLERKKNTVKTIKFSIWDYPNSREVLWPERLPFEAVWGMFQDAKEAGELAAWYAQMEMNPKRLKTLRFDKDKAVQIAVQDAQKKRAKEKHRIYIFVDLAYETKRTSCDTGICVSAHYREGKIDILESCGDKWASEELFLILYNMYEQYRGNCEGVYIETKMFNWVKSSFYTYGKLHKKYGMNVFPLMDRNMGKEQRIRNLISPYDRGDVRFVEGKNQKLLNQLWSWTGEDRDWDVADACAYNVIAVDLDDNFNDTVEEDDYKPSQNHVDVTKESKIYHDGQKERMSEAAARVEGIFNNGF